MKILFLDTETTGLDPAVNSMIEVAMEYHVDGKKIDEFTVQLFDKQSARQVDLNALKVNGQSINKLYALPDESKGVASLTEWLTKLDNKDLVIAGHNVEFDIKFVKATLNKYGITGFDQVVSGRTMDTHAIAKALIYAGKLDPVSVTGKPGTSVGNLAKALGIDLNGRELHSAKDDVSVTAEIFYKMIDLIKK